MTTNLETAYWFLLALLVIVVGINLAANQALLSRLRRDYFSLWTHIGEPGLFTTRNWHLAMRTPRIAWARFISELSDGRVQALVLLARSTDIVSVALLVMLAASFMGMILFRPP